MRGTPNDELLNYKQMLVDVSCIYAISGSYLFYENKNRSRDF